MERMVGYSVTPNSATVELNVDVAVVVAADGVVLAAVAVAT
jgi:hypothetical protein